MTAALQSNVVRLPTAAPRKVSQPRYQTRAYYRAKAELPKHPARHLTFQERMVLLDAEAVSRLDADALSLIIAAMFKALSPNDRAAIVGRLAHLGGTPRGHVALTFLRYQDTTVGNQASLQWALRKLDEGVRP